MNSATLVVFGLIAGAVITLISSANWRVSIRTGLVLVLIEGALRKWVLPQASDLIYFAKDFILLGAYIGFYRNHKIPFVQQWQRIPISVMQSCWVLIIALSLNPNIGSFLGAGLGVRAYLFYLPLIFILPNLFESKQQLLKHLSIYLAIAIPICMLGFLQFRSDSFSVLNTYASGTESYGASTFGTSDKVRITATFSYLSGHVVFVIVFFALAVAALCVPKMPLRSWILFGTLPLVVANAFMSGARAALFAIGLIVVGFLVLATFSGNRGFRKSLVGLMIGGVIVYLAAMYVFPEATENSFGRLQGAGDNTFNRIIEMPLENINIAIDRGGLIGCGTGLTNPSVYSLRGRLNIPPPEIHPGFYDNEMAQVVAEVGVVGFAGWYLFRILVLFSLVRAYTSTQDPVFKALSLAAILVQIPFFLISLVLNHSAGVLVWAITGLGMIPLASVAPKPIETVSRSRLTNRLSPK